MARLSRLDQLLQDWGHEDLFRKGRALLMDRDENARAVGLLLCAADRYRQRDLEGALKILLDARRRFGCMPLVAIVNIIWLCRKMGRMQIAANTCLAMAHDAIAMGFDDLGLEAASAALVLDTMGDFALIRDPARLCETAQSYATAAARPHAPNFAPVRAALKPPYLLALVVPNLVDHIVAYTRTVLHFARYLDRSRFRLKVYVSENLSPRAKPLFSFGCIGDATPERGAATLRELEQRDVPVHIMARDKTFPASARDLAEQLVHDRCNMTLLISGLACPIDWLAVHWAPIPIKAAVHIGTSLFMPGLDVTFFDNPANLEREQDVWSERFGRREVLRLGVDHDEIRAQPALSRAHFGLPENAVVIGTLSNHLATRMTPAYMDAVAGVMEQYPRTWFLALGADDLPEHRAFFAQRGLAERLVLGGSQTQPAAALKTLDIFANEFPVGGSTSVMEAMACGLPVAAMRWSAAHAECAGAEIVGRDLALPSPDPRAYAQRLAAWVADPARARQDGATLRRRAEQYFSAQRYVHDCSARLETLLREKTSAGA